MKRNFKNVINLILENYPVIVPTDTVYGLVCRYDSKEAVEKIYKLKKRDRKKPLILLGYDWKSLKKFVNLNKLSVKSIKLLRYLIKNKWPGPYTIILPASQNVPKYLNKGFKTIGLRVPDNKFLLQCLKQCPDKVLASTSANISGTSDLNPQKEIINKVKLFIKSKKDEMSLKPSSIIEFKKDIVKTIR